MSQKVVGGKASAYYRKILMSRGEAYMGLSHDSVSKKWSIQALDVYRAYRTVAKPVEQGTYV